MVTAASSTATTDYDSVFGDKYKEAKKLEACDIKLILLGDSAVGKSK